MECKCIFLLEESITEELSEVDVKLSQEKLEKKFNPSTTSSKEKLKEEFYDPTPLKKTDNPEDYINKLIDLKKRLREMHNYIINNDDVIDQVMNVLPGIYDNIVNIIRGK